MDKEDKDFYNDLVKKLYEKKKVNHKLISKYFYKYYSRFCCNDDEINIKPMFNNIALGDLITPSKKVAEYYSSVKHYKDILAKNNPITEEMILNYIKCRPSCKIVVLFPKFNKELKLNDKTKLIYQKNIETDYNGLSVLIYNLYLSTLLCKNIKEIHNKLNDIIDKKKNKYLVKVLIIDSDDHIDHFSDLENKNNIYEIKGFLNTISFASFILTNHLDINLKINNIEKMVNINHNHLLINTIKYIMYKYFPLIEHNKFILSGSILLGFLGIRLSNDLDILIDNTPNNKETEKKLIDIFCINYFPRFDVVINNLKNPRCFDYKTMIKNTESMTEDITDKSIKEYIHDTDIYCYINGIKCISIHQIILNKLYTYSVSSLSDVIYLKLKFLPHMKIKYSDKYYDIHLSEVRETDEKFYGKIQNYLRVRYATDLSLDQIKNMFSK